MWGANASLWRRIFAVAILLGLGTVNAQESPSARELFSQTKKAVFQVQIINLDTESQAALGSGFFVGPDGFAVTNFHVVSTWVNRPEKYRIQLETEQKETAELTVWAVDVVNDLAVIKTDVKPAHYLTIGDSDLLDIGDEIFSLGNPQNLGTTIVPGSYSGTIEKSLFDRVHFTGSLNPGMSGGPTLNKQGEVVGVNVAASGNQVSFLVRAKYAKQLLAEVIDQSEPPPQGFKTSIRQQLLDAQQRLTEELLSAAANEQTLGPFTVPGEVLPQIECWGDTRETREESYNVSTKNCSARGYIYLSHDHYVVPLHYRFDYLRTDRLSRFAFAGLYSDYYEGMESPSFAGKEDVTEYACNTDMALLNDRKFRVTYCLREFREYHGLFDVLLKFASAHANYEGVQGELALGAVSRENAKKLIRRFFEGVAWTR